MTKNNSKYFFWGATGFLMIILVLPFLMKRGMFMDGLLYSTVANNFAHANGSFWHLYNSDTLHPDFQEQPPLYFWIMAGFYKVFGDSIYVERFYDFITLILSAFLIYKNWQVVVHEKLKKYAFLPVIFWITIPVCFWAYANNMLEISVTVFVLGSSFFLFKYYFQQDRKHYLIIAGFFLIAGFLTKGFVALFPITIPFFYFIVFNKISLKKWFTDSLLISIIPIIIIAIIFLFETSRTGFTTYLTQRVFHSISSVSTVNTRFHILGRMAMELLPIILLNFLILTIRFLAKRKKSELCFDKKFLFLFLIALSASLPLMITKEQRGFYLVNSFPYYAITIAGLFIPMWQKIVDYISERNWTKKWGHIIGILLIITGLSYSFLQIGKYSRDKEILTDIEVLQPLLKKQKIISVNIELWKQWNIHSYFMRFMNISLDPYSKHEYFLTKKNFVLNDKAYTKVKIRTMAFDLYKKNDVEK